MSLDIRSVKGTGEEKTKGWFVDGSHDWDSFSRAPMNWHNFTLIHVAGEVNPMSGRIECEVALLGLHLRVTYVYDDTWNKDMKRRVAEMRETIERRGAVDVDDDEEGEAWKRTN